jgi:hypothetical protein
LFCYGIDFAGSEILTAVIFCCITPCSLYMNQRFGGMYHLYLQCRKSAEQETSMLGDYTKLSWFPTQKMEAIGSSETWDHVPSISQKMATFSIDFHCMSDHVCIFSIFCNLFSFETLTVNAEYRIFALIPFETVGLRHGGSMNVHTRKHKGHLTDIQLCNQPPKLQHYSRSLLQLWTHTQMSLSSLFRLPDVSSITEVYRISHTVRSHFRRVIIQAKFWNTRLTPKFLVFALFQSLSIKCQFNNM